MAIPAFDVVSLFFLLGVTVVIGYIGLLIFHRTKIPDIIWLLFFGILIGPFTGIVDRELFMSFAPVFSSIAILIILFDAGLNLDFFEVVRNAPKGLLLGTLNIALSMILLGYFAVYFIPGFGFLEGILLGAIIGGTSSAIVIGIVDGLNIRQNVKDILKLESIFTDPLTIVIVIMLLNIITSPFSMPGNTVLRDLLSTFSIGIVLGLLVGLVWLFVLDRVKGKPFDYMITLATLFILYGFSEVSGGSGAMAALAFGLVLGNSRKFSIMLKFKKMFTLDREMKAFHAEVSFFIKSFFFVFLGIIVLVDSMVLVLGITIAAILMISRVIVVLVTTSALKRGEKFNYLERGVILSMTPRGLATAVLAQFPFLFGFPEHVATTFSGVAFVVIIVTVITTTISTAFFSRRAGVADLQEEVKEKIKKNKKIKKSVKSLAIIRAKRLARKKFRLRF